MLLTRDHKTINYFFIYALLKMWPSILNSLVDISNNVFPSRTHAINTKPEKMVEKNKFEEKIKSTQNDQT